MSWVSEVFEKKPCEKCKHFTDCSFGYCDAIKDRYYNLRDGKDCFDAQTKAIEAWNRRVGE